MVILPKAKNIWLTPIIKKYEYLNVPLYYFQWQMITMGYSSPPTPKEVLASVFAIFSKDDLNISPHQPYIRMLKNKPPNNY